VLTFNSTSAASGPPRLEHTLKAGERSIDRGRLPAGHESDAYETYDPDDGTRVRFWRIAQVMQGQCRIYLFTYAYPAEDAARLARVDREVRRMVPHPERL
jgi:hypothetical protein